MVSFPLNFNHNFPHESKILSEHMIFELRLQAINKTSDTGLAGFQKFTGGNRRKPHLVYLVPFLLILSFSSNFYYPAFSLHLHQWPNKLFLFLIWPCSTVINNCNFGFTISLIIYANSIQIMLQKVIMDKQQITILKQKKPSLVFTLPLLKCHTILYNYKWY